MIGEILFTLYIIFTVVQIFFWLFIFSKLAFYKEPESLEVRKEQEVSIIICAKNEAKNLENNLPLILNQNYRSFEVLVVNDNSTDNTEIALLKLRKKYPTLRIATLNSKPKNIKGKKYALSQGIAFAKYDTLLLTDADCCPASKEWLYEMQKPINGSVEVGLGYSPYKYEKGLLNIFIRFETVYTAIQYLSFSLIGRPYMGVGRNLIYRKSLFSKVNGFNEHMHIASGDDDLFINKVSDKKNTKIILNKNSFVLSEPKKTWKDYYHQKMRHLTTGIHYKMWHKILLGGLSFSHLMHYIFAFLLIILKISTMFVGLIYVARILIVLIIYAATLKKFQDKSLLKWIPLLDAAFIFYYIILSPILTYRNTEFVKWK